MAHTDYDLTIIGGGSGGLTAARIGASLGANVLLLDKEKLGGDCLYHGCVPSKSLIHVARTVQQSKEAAQLGLTIHTPEVHMGKVSEYIQGVIGRVGDAEKVYTENVAVKFGHVRFTSPTKLLVNDEEITSHNIIIATGSRPAVPHIEGLEESGYYTNENLFDLQDLPSSLLVIGGGPIGIEMGQSFARLGSKVTIIARSKRLLPKEDHDASSTIAKVLSSEGVEVVLDASLVKVERNGEKRIATVKQDGEEKTFEAEHILIALGRQPNVEGLGLENASIEYDGKKGIRIDEHLQTTTPNIYAIGDVIGGYLFTHVAAYHAGVAVRNALVPVAKKKVDYRVVPWCTFTEPEVARVGLTIEEAEKLYKDVHAETFPVADIDRAQAENETTGFIKLVLAGKKEEIVGVHIVSTRGGEMLGEMTLAMQNNMTINDIYNTIHAYPTMVTGLQQTTFEAYLKSNSASTNRRLVKTLLNFR